MTTTKTERQKTSSSALFGLSMTIVFLMVILIMMGEKMGERFLPIYLMALGGGTFAVSTLNGTDNLLSALYSYPGGYLSDKLGYKWAFTVFNLIAMIGYSIVIAIATWWAVIVGAFFFISWSAISLPAIMSLVADLAGNKRTMGVSLHSLVRRLPMAFGPIFGGYIIDVFGVVEGIRISFSIALVLALIATTLGIFLVKTPSKKEKRPSLHLRESFKLISPKLRILLTSDILIRFAEQIPYAFLVIWVVDYIGLTELQFGILIAIEMFTALLVYIPVAYLADKTTKKPFVTITYTFFTLFPVVVFFSRSFPLLVIAFIIRGLKEFGEPTRKALILDLAPDGAKASTFGTYYLIRDLIVSFAAFSSAILWNIDPMVNFFVASAFGCIGTIYFIRYG